KPIGLKDLCPDDKRRIANLVEELARLAAPVQRVSGAAGPLPTVPFAATSEARPATEPGPSRQQGNGVQRRHPRGPRHADHAGAGSQGLGGEEAPAFTAEDAVRGGAREAPGTAG
ncbi:unnamed protein product, partial [Tetraodon nigroviridis]